MRYFLLLFLVVLTAHADATTHAVGPTRAYISPNALYTAGVVANGDTITIDAGTYTGTATLAIWRANDLVIRGINGRPHLRAAGQAIQGKGIWVVQGDRCTIESIEFSGAIVPSQNGAGIRVDPSGLVTSFTVRRCYFHDNEMGILTANPSTGDMLVEYCEFDNNGFGNGLSHNIYVGIIASLTFRYNYSHHAVVGHNLKSRANENYIYYNRIMDEQTGNSSRLIDLPNGGFSIIMGNVLMQGPNAPNNNLLGYGLEGLSSSGDHRLYVINNTFINKRTASCRFIHLQSGTTIAAIRNNIFGGTTTGSTTYVAGLATTYTNNLEIPNLALLNLADEANYDYRLLATSPAVDSGIAVAPVNGYSLTPSQAYAHPTSSQSRTTNGSAIDIGAYELTRPLSIAQTASISVQVFPNPSTGRFTLNAAPHTIQTLSVLDVSGRIVATATDTNQMDLSKHPNGLYFLDIQWQKGGRNIVTFVKQ